MLRTNSLCEAYGLEPVQKSTGNKGLHRLRQRLVLRIVWTSARTGEYPKQRVFRVTKKTRFYGGYGLQPVHESTGNKGALAPEGRLF